MSKRSAPISLRPGGAGVGEPAVASPGLPRNLRSILPKGKPGRSGPPVCGDIDMRIARDGSWHYMGSPIGRKPLVRLFAAALRRDDDGGFWLVTPAEMCRIRVDDAPFTAVALTATGAGESQSLQFRTNLDETVVAGPDHPVRVAVAGSGEPSPYVLVRDRLEALIARPVFYDLVDLGVERAGPAGPVLGVWSGGAFFELGALDDA